MTGRADGPLLDLGRCLEAEVASHGNPIFAFSWSPDGGRFAFAANWTFDPELYLVDYAGPGAGPAAAVPLAPRPGYDGAPAWSPDGARIAFESDRDGDGVEIYAMDPEGGGTSSA